jgi:hypothetical protein
MSTLDRRFCPYPTSRPLTSAGFSTDVVAKGLKRSTVEQVRGVPHRLFDDAWRAELIEANPVDLELRMLALVARCEGGMRTAT